MIFLGFLVSFIITLYIIPLLIKIALKFVLVDVPDGHVKKHEKSTPYLGGVAIFLGCIATFFIVVPECIILFHIPIIFLTILLIVGFIDDLIVLRPYQKFCGQLIATFYFLTAYYCYESGFQFDYQWLAMAALWMLTIINAFNLIDVMDGLVATVAFGALISYISFAVYLQLTCLASFLLMLGGSLGAFFMYNKPPARIYLGDAGALFLGGAFAITPFFFSFNSHSPYGYFIPIIILAVPLFELIGLVLIRSWHKIPFYKASPHHFSLLLLNKGWKKQTILVFSLFISIISSVIGWLFFLHYIDLIVFLIGFACFIVLWIVALTYY